MARTKPTSARVTGYRSRRTDRQRLDGAASTLREEYRWSIADLLLVYMTADREDHGAEGSRARVGKVVDTIFSSPAVVDEFLDIASTKYSTKLMAWQHGVLRSEQQALGKHIPEFGHLDPKVDLGVELDVSNACSQIPRLAPNLYALLLGLTKNRFVTGVGDTINQGPRVFMVIAILNFCFARQTGSWLQKQLGLYMKGDIGKRRMIGVFNSLGITESWSSLDRVQQAVVRQAKEHLHHFGRYEGVVSQFDNLEVYQTTHSHSTGNSDKMYSMTTGKGWRGVRMPLGGLKQSMFHEERPLLLSEIQDSNGLDPRYVVNNVNVHEAVCMHHIAMAIVAAFPSEIVQIFGKPKGQPWTSVPLFPQLPSIDRLGKHKTEHATLELIMENEATIEGTHNIMDAIYAQQLQMDKELDFDEDLYLVGGDQMTIKNLQAVKRECSTDEDPYERKNWIMAMPGLFHFRIHLIDGIKDVAWGSDDRWDSSMLKTHSVVLNRKQTPVHDVPFTFMESLMRDSMNARIMGFVYAMLQDGLGTADARTSDTNTAFQNRPDVAEKIRHWNPQRFKSVVRQVCQEAFAPEKQVSRPDVLGGVPNTTLKEELEADRRARKARKEKRKTKKAATDALAASTSSSQLTNVGPGLERARQSTGQATQGDGTFDSRDTPSQESQRPQPVLPVETGNGDEELINHIRYLFWTTTYFTLVSAIKYGDVGLIRWVVDRAILLFEARTKRNYANISKWIKRITDSSAAEPELQRAAMANMLVNSSGRADGWFESDRFVEILNLALRNATNAKHNGSFDVEKQLKATSLWANTYGGLRDTVEGQFGYKSNNRHRKRDISQDLHNLAYKLSLASIRRKPAGVEMPWQVPDLVAEGMHNLVEGGLGSFNARVVHRYGQFDRYRAFRGGGHEDDMAAGEDEPRGESDRVYEERRGLGAFSAEDRGDVVF